MVEILFYFKRAGSLIWQSNKHKFFHRFTYLESVSFHALGTSSAWPMSEALIESRQFIGWWRDVAPDALTSSAYTCERAIYSSDFSAFTKPFGCDFSGPKIIYFGHGFSVCASVTVELCSPRGEVPWNNAVVKRCVLDLSRAMTSTVC